MANKILSIVAYFLIFFASLAKADVFEEVLDDVTPCKKVCKNTFTPHTFEKSGSEECCNRGCRLFSMMEFIYDDINKTTEVCRESCEEAYPDKEDYEACSTGCKNQKPFALDLLRDEPGDLTMHLISPVMYFHNLYSNIMGNVMNRASVSWSVYMQANDGSVIEVRSLPTFNIVEISDDSDSSEEEYNTAGYIETNIEPQDNSATPFLKNSQFKAQRNDDDIIDLSIRDLNSGDRKSSKNTMASDWLSCVANKTGIPRLLLSWLLLMCAIVMIWLCLSAAVTAPDQRVITQPQKLSINGDQEVMAELLALGIKPSYPKVEVHGQQQAKPLPLKISVQRI